MKSFKELRRELEEHPNLRARIIAKINPMDKLRDKMDDLKKLPGKVGDRAMDKLKDTIDKINPMSPINKKVTMMRKDKISDLVDKKRDLTIKAKGIGTKIKSLRAKTKK
jgi:tRNA A37 threonylcarbamoyladenosine dehydratase